MAREATPPPAVVLLELQPHAMARAGYEGGALRLLRTMHSWGYTDVSHSGCVLKAGSFTHSSRGLVPAFLQRSGAPWNTQHAKGLYQETCMTADDTACRGFQVLGRYRCIRHDEFIHQCRRHVHNHRTQEDEEKGIRGA
jgi:hypothetical protein